MTLISTGCEIQAVALAYKIRMLDLAARKAHKVERVPQVATDNAIVRLVALLALWKASAS